MSFGGGVSGGVVFAGGIIPPSTNPLPGLVKRTAGQAILGHHVVFVGSDNKVWLSDANAPEDGFFTVCGVTETSATVPGQDIFVRFTGELKDPSLNWAQSPIWLGPGGVLTQEQPTTGHLFMVGVPLGPQSMQIMLHHIAFLA
jgi:hypothetical protein